MIAIPGSNHEPIMCLGAFVNGWELTVKLTNSLGINVNSRRGLRTGGATVGERERGNGRIREAAHAAGSSVGGSAQISGDAARSRTSRQRADRGDPEGHEARLPSPRLGRVEMPR